MLNFAEEFKIRTQNVVEEADESVFWIEIIKDANILASDETIAILNETTEILKIVSRSGKTLKDKKLKEITH